MKKKDAALKLLKLVSNQIGTDKRNNLPKEFGEVFSVDLEKYMEDKGLSALFKKFGIDSPEKMVNFIMQFFSAALESISSDINSINRRVMASITRANWRPVSNCHKNLI